MTIDFNTGPYYDDFDPANNFYKVLFKPGYAVQARELNQLQSILQNQVSSVGKHLFKKNSMVIPGGIVLNNAADIVSITGVDDVSTLVGQTITDKTNFDYTADDDSEFDGYITAVVLAAKPATATAPAALYVKYFKTGDAGAVFQTSTTLSTVGETLIQFQVHPTIAPSIGKVATISKGTFFTREVFVDVGTQSIIIETDNKTVTNCVIGLNITESIVTSDDDETLLDNSNGSPNQYAPGADRYKIDLTLARVDVTTTINEENFIKMMVVENNNLTYVNNKTEYAELMKTLARRTFDANGNFIVRGLETTITDAPGTNYIWANITRGKCYLGGYEYEQIAPSRVAIPKAREEQVMPTVTKYTADMPFMYVAGGVNLLKEIPPSNSLVQFTNAIPDGTDTIIGYGVFKDIQYAFGTPGEDDIYKMYFESVFLDKGRTVADIGGVKLPAANEGAPVLHELRLSNVNGTFAVGDTLTSGTGGTDTGLIFGVYDYILYVIKNTSNAVPAGDTVNSSSSGTATRRLTFVSNYDKAFIPMYEVDQNTYKTLGSTSYSIIRRDDFEVGASADSYPIATPLGTNEIFEEFSTSDYFAYIEQDEVFIELLPTNIDLAEDGKSYSLVVGAGSDMLGKTVYVYSTVNKTGVTHASKTATSGVTNIVTPSTSWMALAHQDVQSLDKVVEGRIVNVVDATDDGGANPSWASSTATIVVQYRYDTATGSQYQHEASDKIDVRGIKSANNTTGAYNSGFNGIKTIASRSTVTEVDGDDTIVTVTITYALAGDPGAYAATDDATVALAPNLTKDPVITSRYKLLSGNDAYMTGTGLIKKKDGAVSPSGQIGVGYTYYTVDTDGGYVSVDSYQPAGSTNLNYIGEIRNVKDIFDNTIEMRRYIDFRIRPSAYFFKNAGDVTSGQATLTLRDLNLSAHAATLVNKRIIGPGYLNGTAIIASVTFDSASGNSVITLKDGAGDPLNATASSAGGTFYIGLNGSDLSLVDSGAGGRAFAFPREGSRFTYSYTAFKPRQVLVYVDRQEDTLAIKYMDVRNLAEAAQFRRSEYKMPLVHVQMEPYTLDITEVTPFKFVNPVYHMLDIHNLKSRIDRNEYYASLALNRDVEGDIKLAGEEGTTSAYGFWNEDFMDLKVQDYDNGDFNCTVYDRSYVSPGVVTRTVPLRVAQTASTTWALTSTAVTLPYTEVRAFGNNKASRTNNLNPYNMIQWQGKLTLSPSVDNWIDTNTTVVVTTVTSSANDVTQEEVRDAKERNDKVKPQTPSHPHKKLPAPSTEEVITKIHNVKTKIKDSRGSHKGIHFEYETSHGRKGKVHTDAHLSPIVKALGERGHDGTHANELINKKVNDPGVKEYLNAGRHFDHKKPEDWKRQVLPQA